MKKIKLDYWTFYNFLRNRDNGYYDSWRTNLIDKNGNKVRGTAYKLDRTLTDEDKTFLISWKNVKLFIAQMQYAPEIKHNTVFIADKCL